MTPFDRPATALPAAAFALALLAGCSGSGVMGARTSDRPPADVQELRARVLELQRQAAVTEVELERLRRKVAELESRFGGGSAARPAEAARSPAPTAPSRSSAPSPPAPRAPVLEVEDLSGEEASRRGPTPSSAPPRAVEERAPSGSVPAPQGSAAASAITPEAQALYDRGYTLYHQGRYVDAESSFQRFIQSHPATELADNAQYWIGESRLARGDVAGALAAFRETVQRFPEGNKVPDALLKVGEAMASLGDVEGAREAYQEVVRRYAGSTAAAVAQDRLRSLP